MLSAIRPPSRATEFPIEAKSSAGIKRARETGAAIPAAAILAMVGLLG
jgi:hypothetical protein